MVKVIKRGKKRYVRIGSKQIKVHKSISERELIQWLIKTFKRKRHTKNTKKDEKDKDYKPFTVVTSEANADSVRIAARETKDKLDTIKQELLEAQKELKEEIKVERKRLKRPDNVFDADDAKQALPALPPGGNDPQLSKAEHEKLMADQWRRGEKLALAEMERENSWPSWASVRAIALCANLLPE